MPAFAHAVVIVLLVAGSAFAQSNTSTVTGTSPTTVYNFSVNVQQTIGFSTVASVAYVWEIPGGSRLWNNLLTRTLLDKWQVAGVGSFASGRPSGVSFSTTDSADILGGGDAGRINVTCDPSLPRGDRTFTRWFDTACFARPARGDAGNATRSVIRLPGTNSWDLTFSKMLVGRQGRGAQFRAELYNAFNQVIWTSVNTAARFDPAGTQVNGQFGQVTSAGNPRVVQLAVRVMF